MISNYEHEIMVQAFLEAQKLKNPDEYAEVAQKYPVQDRARAVIIRRREIPVGLLGLSPSRISIGTASKGDVESIYARREES
jgi:hypothetical protein